MSQETVGEVITRLLSDEDLRIRFALDPLEALAELQSMGMALTPHEIDVFVQSDVRLWFGERRRGFDWLH
ncbi:MAG TPA: hypothetical protein VGY48_34540 [Vicinamibacterales bacterium]|jgi:hypothetical protein|nr:hypothetical protein [Vicinamibacterales bacterium]